MASIRRKSPEVEIMYNSSEPAYKSLTPDECCATDEKRIKRFVRIAKMVPPKLWTLLMLLVVGLLIRIGIPMEHITSISNAFPHFLIDNNETNIF